VASQVHARVFSVRVSSKYTNRLRERVTNDLLMAAGGESLSILVLLALKGSF